MPLKVVMWMNHYHPDVKQVHFVKGEGHIVIASARGDCCFTSVLKVKQ